MSESQSCTGEILAGVSVQSAYQPKSPSNAHSNSNATDNAIESSSNNNAALSEVQQKAKAEGEDLTRFVGDAENTTAKYTRVRLLGRGSFGKAHLVKRNCDAVVFAMKEMDMSSMSAHERLYVKSEIECLALCKHFAIIGFVESAMIGSKMLVVMQFADAGDLNMQIKGRLRGQDNNVGHFEEHEVAYTFVQLALALESIHRRRVIHRDIKSANVLVHSNGIVALADFGLSRSYEETVSSNVASTYCGTPYQVAPEIWKRQRYSKKADVWALGVLLFELMTLKRPFTGQGMSALAQAIKNRTFSVELATATTCSPEWQDICMRMLTADPTQRPSMSDILKLPFMEKVVRDLQQSAMSSTSISDDVKRQIASDIQEAAAARAAAAAAAFSVDRGASFRPTDVTHEGTVRKESGGGVWKERYLVLRDGQLVISICKDGPKTKSLPVSAVVNVMPVAQEAAARGASGVFSINTNDLRVIWFQAPTAEEMGLWVQRIQEALGVA